MPRLIIQYDQTGAAGKRIVHFKDGITPTEMLMQEIPGGLDPNANKLFINLKEASLPSEQLFEPLFNNDTVVIIKEVKGIDPITAIYIAVAAVVAAGAAILLAPGIPGNVGSQKQSPNNTLQGQTNVARPYQAYPLIFGSPRSYPDLTGEAVNEYVDQTKIVTQLMNIGIGLFEIDTISAGETPLVNFTGSSSEIFEPVNKNVVVAEVVNGFESNEINGQALPGTNEGEDGDEYNMVENTVTPHTFVGSVFTIHVDQDSESDDLKTDFDAAVGPFNLFTEYRRGVQPSGSVLSNGVGTIGSMTLIADVGGDYYTIVLNSFSGPKADAGVATEYFGPFDAVEKIGLIIGPINTAVECDELWANIVFKRGLKGTASFTLDTIQLDGLNGSPIGGTEESFMFSLENDDSQVEAFFTEKNVLANGRGFYQFTLTRTDESKLDPSEPDAASIEEITCITRDNNVSFGNVTLVRVSVPATLNATSLKENQINIELTSKLITFENGQVITTPEPSRKFADALLHMYVDFYGLDSSTLDLVELYALQDKIDDIDTRLATFDFTFDDIDVTLDERMDSILNVSRCFKWLDGDVYRFARNDAREFESTIITRKDISFEDDREYSMNYNPQMLNNFDSVNLQFVDTSINKKAYIKRKIDSNGDIVDGLGLNPKKINLAGCQESFNAINRAELEIRSLIFNRYTLQDTMLPVGMLLDKGDMVLYSEQYNVGGNIFDGEIIAINGSIATTSESIVFEENLAYQIHYMLNDGSTVGPFDITEVEDQPFQFESSDLQDVFLRDSVLGFLIQTGSRYIISTFENLQLSRWTVIEKSANNKNVDVTMVNYDDRVYEFDNV